MLSRVGAIKHEQAALHALRHGLDLWVVSKGSRQAAPFVRHQLTFLARTVPLACGEG